MSARRRPVDCKCGNNLYERTFAWSPGADITESCPIWKCTNCGAETERGSNHRKSNAHRALNAYLALRREWATTDAALSQLVEQGRAMGGALLVHSSTFNYHLKQLSGDKPKLSNWDIKYHTDMARQDLAKARLFVAGKGEQ